MAFKMSKAQIKERDEKVAALETAATNLKQEIEESNTRLTEIRENIEAKVNEYNSALEDAKEFMNNIGNDARSEFDDKSEKWQEGDRGQEVSSWIDELENFSPDEIKVELPDDIEEPDLDHGEEITGLAEEPG